MSDARIAELEAVMGERDIYEVANQLHGYVDMDTPEDLKLFLVREARAAASLAERIRATEAENARLREALAVEIESNLWNAYNVGFERDGLWMDGARSEGEWLQDELGLPDGGYHDAAAIRARIPSLAREMAARSAGIRVIEVTEPTGGAA